MRMGVVVGMYKPITWIQFLVDATLGFFILSGLPLPFIPKKYSKLEKCVTTKLFQSM